jgi:hypothetical protein
MPGGYGKRIATMREAREMFGDRSAKMIEFIRFLDAVIASRQFPVSRIESSWH